MSESGDVSRRSREELFKRRRSPRPNNTSEQHSRSQLHRDFGSGSNGRGDMCQLGESSTQTEPAKQSNRFGWLFKRRNRTDVTRRGGAESNTSRSVASRRMERRSRLTSSNHTLNGDQTASLEQRALLAHSRFDARSTANDPAMTGNRPHLRGRSQLPQSQPVSLNQRRGRSDSRSQIHRSTNTCLQSDQPTLINPHTTLQQTTYLQDQDHTEREGQRGAVRRSRKRTNFTVRPRSRSLAIALYAARMLILSVGVGVLAGTILSALSPSNSLFFSDSLQQSIKQASSVGKQSSPQASAASAQGQELTPLKTALQAIVQQHPGFTPGIFLIDLDNNNFLDWSGTTSFSAASTIKVPVLIAFFQDVDAGKIRLDEKLTMTKELIASESGDMQYLPPGAQFTALETATKMITISDNTATNMLIARLGGVAALNQRFKDWGLSATVINSALPDLKGTNTTSPKELTNLMVRVSQGELVSLRSRDRLLDIMRRTVNNSQLPQGIGEGATIAHKTGDIGNLIGDVGLIDMPNGKRYATAVLVKRAKNDDRAYDLVAKVSRLMYQHLNSPATSANRSATPASPVQATPYTPDFTPKTDTDAQRQPANPNTPERSPVQPDPIQASTP